MRSSKEFKIGLLAVVSLLILYFGFNFLKGQDFLSPTHSYYVFYDNVNGLTSSNQVLIDGFNVGMVGDMEIDQGEKTRILVELQIKKNITVGSDAMALLVDTDLLGGKAIKVFPGDIGDPALPDDTIRGQVQKSLAEEFADRAMPVVQSFDSTILGVNEFFTDYSSLSSTLEQAIINIRNLAYNLNNMTLENRSKINATFSNLDTITEEMTLAVRDFRKLSAKLNRTADSLDPAEMAATLRSMRANLESLQVVTKRMADGEGTMGKLSEDEELYNNLNRAIQDLDSLLVDLKENPKRYVRLSLF